jgi:glycosyltransferase involved in cell wall biosynthesis
MQHAPGLYRFDNRRRIRIASVIADLGFGGSENRLLSFASTIDRSRFEHTVLTLYRQEKSREQLIGSRHRAYADAGVEVIDMGLAPQARILPSRRPADLARAVATLSRLLDRLCRVIRERHIDLIDAQHATASLVGVLAAALTGRPVTVTEYYPYYFARPGMRLLGNAVFQRAEALICDSTAHSDLINRWLTRPHPRPVVVPNGLPRPMVTQSREITRDQMGIPPDAAFRVVGQVSRLVPHKGQRTLLQAARKVLNQEPGTYFVLTGYSGENPSYVEQLKRDAFDLQIADRVRIVSWPGSIGDIWEVLDIHVHASVEDSLPIAITEGMSFGKPAVVTDVGGVCEMVIHEKTGLVVPMHDPDSLAAGILRLLREPELAARLGAAARERYRQSYGPEVMTRTLENLFVDIMDRRRSHS